MSASKQQQAKPHYHGHRDRLRQRLLDKGGAALADYEILEFLLFGAKPRTDTKPLAKALMKRFGGLAAVLAAEPSELAKVPGLGDASIAALKIVPEAARRLAREQVMGQPVLSSWGKLLDYCRISLAHEKVERFHLLFLDRQNRLIADETQQRGTVDHTPVYPREVVRRALELGASALILVHNHPSGDPTPSQADIEMTREIVAAGEKLGISVHDHVVIGKSGETSFKTAGLL
jgi:DNA repair protein RadC